VKNSFIVPDIEIVSSQATNYTSVKDKYSITNKKLLVNFLVFHTFN